MVFLKTYFSFRKANYFTIKSINYLPLVNIEEALFVIMELQEKHE